MSTFIVGSGCLFEFKFVKRMYQRNLVTPMKSQFTLHHVGFKLGRISTQSRIKMDRGKQYRLDSTALVTLPFIIINYRSGLGILLSIQAVKINRLATCYFLDLMLNIKKYFHLSYNLIATILKMRNAFLKQFISLNKFVSKENNS